VRRFFYILQFILLSLYAVAQPQTPIQISINSGNPVFPFPQFQAYQNPTQILGNLATKNSVGVPHAEMEQTIRDAYRIMMNRAVYTGQVLNGVKYIRFRSSPNCSEGDGYGLLGAVSMADKQTFDGMWLWIHDSAMKKVTRYIDCGQSSPGYNYSQLPDWMNNYGNGSSQGSATDGDVDIGLALLIAYRQWGEFMGINDACGNPISYKKAAIDFLKGMTDTVVYALTGSTLVSGDIGLDGYIKGGDKGANLTDWAASTARSGFSKPAEPAGPSNVYFDYAAPSYFRQFADFLAQEDSTKYAWNIYQFRRAEASSDWLMGQLYGANPKNLPISGNVTVTGTTASLTFTGNMGEDFRAAWRTVLNYVWNGNPGYSWNASTHQVDRTAGSSWEQKIGTRFASYLWDNRQAPWNKACSQSTGTNPFAYWGPSMLVTDIDMIGNGGSFYFLNWIPSVGSSSALAAQDFKLMSDLYRYLEIEWDVETPGDGYLTSVPVYYHGWYRVLGLLLLSGNYHSPLAIKPTANMKVYLGIDKTFAFQGDTATYTLSYRNYGSLDAGGVTIVDTLHPDFVFCSATKGGTFNAATHTVSWTTGTVPGFKTATGIGPDTGQVQLKVKVGNATQKQYRNKASITCTNGTGWTSNEYPNRITSVMERNYLDIAKRALIIKQTASVNRIKPGATVDYTITFQNTSEAGWINGGRPGVHFSFSQTVPNGGVDARNTMRFRIFHDADEAYIDFGNYRVSYFLYDSLYKSIAGTGSQPGWQQSNSIIEPRSLDSSLTFAHELITEGRDSLGRWNQRLILQFSDPAKPNRAQNLATIDHHLSQYRGMSSRIHRGGTDPLRLVWFFNSSDWKSVNWSDDWSWDAKASQDDAGYYFPVTNDWTDLNDTNLPVNTWNPKACSTATHTIKNVLVEEWDGYTWRRVAGNGPMPGRDLSNVVIRDTIPAGLTFVNFTSSPPLGIAPTINGRVITWTIPKLQINQKGTISFTAKADGACPTADKLAVNRAWAVADKESANSDSTVVLISCDTATKVIKKRFLTLSPSDSMTDYPGNRGLFTITLTDSAGAVVTGEDLTLSLTPSDPLLAVFADATSPTAVTSVALVNGRAVIAVSGTAPVVGTITISPVSPPSGTIFTPATLRVTIIPKPSWPYIVSASMTDPAGNMVPGLVNVMMSDTFSSGAVLSSAQVVYGANTIAIPLSSITQNGRSLQLNLPGGLTADPTPKGTLLLTILVGGDQKIVQGPVTDGIGPQITSAVLLENADPSKTMVLVSFSELVQPQRIQGQTLEGIIAGRTDTLVFTVDSSAVHGGASTYALRALSGTIKFSVGDRIRLAPGSGGMKDLAGNTPHPLNPFVTIGSGPTPVKRAVYFDGNGDGFVDSVIVYFGRAVSTPSLVISFDWGDTRTDTLGSRYLGYFRNDSAGVTVRIDSAFSKRILRTSTPMAASMLFRLFPEEQQSFRVSDSAAPVLIDAVYCPGEAAKGSTTTSPDTVSVQFSEAAQQFGQITPLQFVNPATGTAYSLSLSFLSENRTDSTIRYLVTSTPGTFTVAEGDSVWMSTGAFGDVNSPSVVQQNPKNRRVPLRIKTPGAQIVITLSQNPFTPAKSGDPLKIDVSYQSTVSFASELQASAKIYDALGNCVYAIDRFSPRASNAVVGSWPGVNRMNRMVGTGTYLAIIHAHDGKTVNVVKKMVIGVKR
jgi:uncharacterized repeat protein (TIGR01451 family)